MGLDRKPTNSRAVNLAHLAYQMKTPMRKSYWFPAVEREAVFEEYMRSFIRRLVQLEAVGLVVILTMR